MNQLSIVKKRIYKDNGAVHILTVFIFLCLFIWNTDTYIVKLPRRDLLYLLAAVYCLILAGGIFFEQRFIAPGAVILTGLIPALFSRSDAPYYLAASLLAPALFFILKNKWISRILSLFLLAVLIYGYVFDVRQQRTVIVMTLGLFLYELLSFLDREVPRWFQVLMALSILVALIPNPRYPLGLYMTEFGSKIEYTLGNFTERFRYLFSGTGFLAGTGYGGLGQPGRVSSGGDTVQLELSGIDPNHVLYLKGASFSEYKGTHWLKGTGSSETPEAKLARFLTLLYENEITADEAYTFSELTINASSKFGYLKTSDAILPEGFLASGPSSDYELIYSDGNFEFDRIYKKDFTYRYSYLGLDYGAPLLCGLIRQASAQDSTSFDGETAPLPYQTLSDYFEKLYGKSITPYLTAAQYEEYTKESDLNTLLDTSYATERMKELALRITESASSDFDKAKAIEAYLRQYTYDRNASGISSDNFVDSFLFETQKGYCVHYASAMVMLCRLNGIPAGYAEGFRFDPKDRTALNKEHSQKHRYAYNVLNDNAHAWPEVYIKGFGFVPFEPTANMPNAEASGWGRKLASEDAASEDGGYGGAASGQSSYPQAQDSDAENTPIPVVEAEEAIKEAARTRQRVILTLLQVLTAYLLITFGLVRLIAAVRYRLLPPEKQLSQDARNIAGALSKLYFKDLETKPRTLTEAADMTPDPAIRQAARQTAELFYEVRFGDGTCSRAEASASHALLKVLQKKVRRQKVRKFLRLRQS